MYCVLAVEAEIAEIIKTNLKKIEPYAKWRFDTCEHAWKLDEYSRKNPDVLVLSRFLPGEEPIELLKHINTLFPGSHIVLLVGDVDEKCRGYLRAARSHGLNNYVVGKLPGDRPYTLLVALTQPRETGEDFNGEEIAEETVINVKQRPDKAMMGKEESEIAQYNYPGNTEREGIFTPEDRLTYTTGTESKPMLENKRITFISKNKKERKRRFNRGGVFTMVTSNKGGVGKTTVSVTMAVALARSGVPTVITDFDLEGPNVATFFDIKDVPGIEYLAGRSINPHYLEDLLVEKEENLFVLPGVMNKTLPVFEQGQLLEIVEGLMETFPVVIGDTPPGFWTKEWLTELFMQADIVFSVVDQSKFSEQETRDYAPRLLLAGVEPDRIKIVLNRFNPKLHNARIIEKHFCAGFKENVPQKLLPRVAATIPEDWVAYTQKSYKGEVVGLDDIYSQWHRLAEEVARLAGYQYKKPEKKKKGFGSIFKRLRRG